MAIHIVPRSLTTDAEQRPASAPSIASNRGASADHEWSIADCGRALLLHRNLVLAIAGAAITLAALASALQRPMYQSRASIQIQGLNENFLNLRDVYPTAAPTADNAVYIQTQAEILRQDAVLEQVVRKLRLDERPEFHRPGRTALDELRNNVQIVNARGSSLIHIICSAPDPGLAAALANTLAQTFIDQSIQARQRSAKETHDSLSLERDALGRKINDGEAAIEAMSKSGKDTAAITDLKRELDAGRRYYQVISERVDQARVASTVSQTNLRLVSQARPAAHPYRPNLLLNLVIGAVGGLVLGIGYVMLREQTSPFLHSPGEAAAYLGLPELGAIPQAMDHRFPLRLANTGIHTVPVERASIEPSSSGLSEAFRATLASILSTQGGGPPCMFGVTSARALEGKTTVASNLAIGLAEIGSTVLLIDADLRRPRLHKIFDQPNSWGLSDLLREKNAIEELPLAALVKRTGIPRLSLLPSGTSASNIFGLLWSGRMARLLPGFKQLFDYVLIDTPPCLEFADARIIGRNVETLLLVVRADSTEKQTARAAVERLQLDGTPVMGFILNRCDPARCGIDRYAVSPREFA